VRHRPSAQVWPVVQLARHHSDGDFIEFWVDWGLYVPGLPLDEGETKSLSPYSCPVSGRAFEGEDTVDRHWIIALGQMGHHRPNDVFGTDIKEEIGSRLANDLLPLLDRYRTIQSVIEALEHAVSSDDRFLGTPGPPLEVQRNLAKLRGLVGKGHL
jgi:hypothetical protein